MQDRAFAGVHGIKTNIWLFVTVNTKQCRSVQLSKIKRISMIAMLFVVIDSISVIHTITYGNITEYFNAD